jgi:hypothetical protein
MAIVLSVQFCSHSQLLHLHTFNIVACCAVIVINALINTYRLKCRPISHGLSPTQVPSMDTSSAAQDMSELSNRMLQWYDGSQDELSHSTSLITQSDYYKQVTNKQHAKSQLLPQKTLPTKQSVCKSDTSPNKGTAAALPGTLRSHRQVL